MSVIDQPVRSGSDTGDESSLRHVYPPWSFQDMGCPPVGAVALCGYVRRETDAAEFILGYDHPEACVVCTELAGRAG